MSFFSDLVQGLAKVGSNVIIAKGYIEKLDGASLEEKRAILNDMLDKHGDNEEFLRTFGEALNDAHRETDGLEFTRRTLLSLIAERS